MSISTGSGGRKIRSFNEINITPLTDIFLVLLIMMMVLAPMFQQNDRKITVPKIISGAPMEEQAITVEVSKEGQLKLDGKVLSDSQLVPALKQYVTNNPKLGIVVRADKEAKGDPVMKVFDAASIAGFQKLTVAGEPEKEERLKQRIKGDASAETEVP